MNDDPDLDAMANSPIRSDGDEMEIRQTDVIEGGAAGGLFLADEHDDSEEDEALTRARRRADELLESNIPLHDRRRSSGMEDLMDIAEDDLSDERDESESEEEEEDDPIIKTFDIYAAKRLAEHLHLFQYPIRPPKRPYTRAEQPIGARLKPKTGLVEIEIPITDSPHYDNERATKWTSEALRQHTIGGTIRKGRNYLIGVIRDDELHVTPLKGVAQLRPNFNYIDSHDAEDKEAKKSDAMAERGPRAAKAIQMSAKSSDAVPDLSTTALIRAAEEENWTRLQWKEAGSDEARSILNHMISKKKNVICESVTDKNAYLDLLSAVSKEIQEAPGLPVKTLKKTKKSDN